MSIGEQIVRFQKNTDLIYGTGYLAGLSVSYDKGYQDGYSTGGLEGYTAGVQAGTKNGAEDERRKFWRVYQGAGQRNNYQSAFTGFGFDFDIFYPLYDICPKGNCTAMFFGWNSKPSQKGSLKARLEECGVRLDTSEASNLTQLFYNSFFTELPTIALPAQASNRLAFGKNPHLVSIERLIVEEGTYFDNCFSDNGALEHLIFTGVIGQNGLDVSPCPNLSGLSVASILDCLKDLSGTGITRTVTLGPENFAKLTAQQIESAQAKGWILKG